jgi:hypothetical protein
LGLRTVCQNIPRQVRPVFQVCMRFAPLKQVPAASRRFRHSNHWDSHVICGIAAPWFACCARRPALSMVSLANPLFAPSHRCPGSVICAGICGTSIVPSFGDWRAVGHCQCNMDVQQMLVCAHWGRIASSAWCGEPHCPLLSYIPAHTLPGARWPGCYMAGILVCAGGWQQRSSVIRHWPHGNQSAMF